MVTKQSLFLKTPAWKIIQRTQLNNYIFNLWLQDQVPDKAAQLKSLQALFTIDETYLDNNIDLQLLKTRIFNVISTLTHKEQQVLALYFYFYKKPKQIAELFGVAIWRINTILSRAIRRMAHATRRNNYNIKDWQHLF